MRKFVLAVAFALIAAILLLLIYPAIGGEAANGPDDKFGEAVGTILIPLSGVLGFGVGLYLERPRRG